MFWGLLFIQLNINCPVLFCIAFVSKYMIMKWYDNDNVPIVILKSYTIEPPNTPDRRSKTAEKGAVFRKPRYWTFRGSNGGFDYISSIQYRMHFKASWLKPKAGMVRAYRDLEKEVLWEGT